MISNISSRFRFYQTALDYEDKAPFPTVSREYLLIHDSETKLRAGIKRDKTLCNQITGMIKMPLNDGHSTLFVMSRVW